MKKIIYISIILITFIGALSVINNIYKNNDPKPPTDEYKKPTEPYGFDYLNSWQKEIYKILESDKLKIGDEYDLKEEQSIEDVQFVIALFYQNNPYMMFKKYNVIEILELINEDESMYIGTKKNKKIKPAVFAGVNVQKEYEMLNKIEDKANDIISSFPDSASDYEKIKIIYNYLIENVQYDSKTANNIINEVPLSDDNQSASPYGALINHLAICSGIAQAFQYVATKAGIYSLYIESTERNHAWNIVWLDGKYYRLDATIQLFLTKDSYNNDYITGISIPETKYYFE